MVRKKKAIVPKVPKVPKVLKGTVKHAIKGGVKNASKLRTTLH